MAIHHRYNNWIKLPITTIPYTIPQPVIIPDDIP